MFGQIFQDVLHAIALGVRDEYLTKTPVEQQADEVLHAPFVQFVEYVVQQQNGIGVFLTTQHLVLRQPKRQEKRLQLALRSKFFERLPVHGKFQVIAVWPHARAL